MMKSLGAQASLPAHALYRKQAGKMPALPEYFLRSELAHTQARFAQIG